MPANQFGGHRFQHPGNIEPASLFGDLRMHDGQENEVAQFFAQILVVPRADGAGDLVGFLDQARQERFVRLFAVPGTAVRRPEFGHDFAKLVER